MPSYAVVLAKRIISLPLSYQNPIILLLQVLVLFLAQFVILSQSYLDAIVASSKLHQSPNTVVSYSFDSYLIAFVSFSYLFPLLLTLFLFVIFLDFHLNSSLLLLTTTWYLHDPILFFFFFIIIYMVCLSRILPFSVLHLTTATHSPRCDKF